MFDFGDIVINKSASKDNPTRKGIFVRYADSDCVEYVTAHGLHTTPADNLEVERTPWVVCETKDNTMHCQRCDEKESMKILEGKRVGFAAGIMKAFVDCHKECEKRHGRK